MSTIIVRRLIFAFHETRRRGGGIEKLNDLFFYK